MLQFIKDESLTQREMPFGVVEVQFPLAEEWNSAAFYAEVETRIGALKARYPDSRPQGRVRGEPLRPLLQKVQEDRSGAAAVRVRSAERPAVPRENPVTGIPFLAELETFVLCGTHDADQVQGAVRLFSPGGEAPLPRPAGRGGTHLPRGLLRPGRRGHHLQHDCPGRTAAPARGRRAATSSTRSSGFRGRRTEELAAVQELLVQLVRTLAPAAAVETALL